MFVLLPLPPAIWEWMRCDERPPGELRTKSHLLQDSGGSRFESWNDECTCRPKHNLHIYIYIYALDKNCGQVNYGTGINNKMVVVLWPLHSAEVRQPPLQPLCWKKFSAFEYGYCQTRFNIRVKFVSLWAIPIFRFSLLPLPHGQQPAFNFPILVLTVLHIGAMPAARNVCSPQLSIRLSRMQVALLLLFGLPPIVFPGTNLHCSAFLWS